MSKQQQDNSRIKVIARFRPMNDKEINSGGTCIMDVLDSKTIKHRDPGNLSNSLSFTFDRIFDKDSVQQEIYEEVGKGLVDAIFQGINGTLFAYGQTSSGKTHTCLGPSITDPQMKGVIPRIIDDIFQKIKQSPSCVEFRIKVSILQIYMQKIRDLLDPGRPQMKVRESKARGVYIQGITEIYVSCTQQIMNLLAVGASNRCLDHTNMNQNSSRSHMVVTITLYQSNPTQMSARTAKLTMIDLAGSQKVNKSGVQGRLLDQAKQINKSLSALGNVINALSQSKPGHIPYRDSKLTRILQQSLGGNAKTNLILNCSPCSIQQSETISTLRFGARAKTIKNRPKINRQYTVQQLILLLEKAQRKIQEQDKLIRQLYLKCKTQAEKQSFLNTAKGMDIGSIIGTPVNGDKEQRTPHIILQDEQCLSEEEEEINQYKQNGYTNRIYQQDLLKALEQQRQEKTALSRNLQALTMKYDMLQDSFFDIKSSVNILQKKNESLVHESVKREMENREQQDRIKELEETLSIYNDGLKNMVQSADAMKKDAKRMSLSSSVNPQKIQNIATVVKKVSQMTERKLRKGTRQMASHDDLTSGANNTVESRCAYSMQQLDHAQPGKLQSPTKQTSQSQESLQERCRRLRQQLLRLKQEKQRIDKLMQMEEGAKAKRILALENYLVEMSTDFYLLKGQEYRWKTDHSVYQNQLKRRGQRIHYLERQLQKLKENMYLMKVKYDELAASKTKDSDLSDLNIDFTEYYPKQEHKKQLNIVKVLKSSTQKINEIMTKSRIITKSLSQPHPTLFGMAKEVPDETEQVEPPISS